MSAKRFLQKTIEMLRELIVKLSVFEEIYLRQASKISKVVRLLLAIFYLLNL